MKRALWPYFLFAVLGAALALAVTLEKPADHREGQIWQTFKVNEIKEILYETPTKSVTVTPLSSSYAWVDFAEKDASAQRFLAGPKSKDLWFELSPIWASKLLGKASDLKLSTYGLDKEDNRFTIVDKNASKIVYILGGRGFQSSEYFVLDKQRGEVFLWDRRTVNLLDNARQRLSVDSPSFLNPEGLTKVQLAFDGKERSLTRTNGQWSEQEKPLENADPLLRWLEGVSKLKAESFLNPGSPKGEVLFSLELEGASLWSLQFYFDPKALRYTLSFGDNYPSLVLDEKSFAPFYAEMKQGKLTPNI